MSACFLITCKYELIVHSKRRAFPSISGEGNRLQAPLKKGKRITDRKLFLETTKKNHERVTSAYSRTQNKIKILSEEKLAVFKKAKLGKKKKVFPETRMKTFSIVKMFFK